MAELQCAAPDSASAWLQSLTSRALGADLHPAAHFGKGVFIAHPLGAPLPARAFFFCWMLSSSVVLMIVVVCSACECKLFAWAGLVTGSCNL